MKQLFFTFLAIALPVIAFGGVIYMFLHGLYRLFDDWRLARELNDLRRESELRRRENPAPKRSVVDPLAAFDDRPPVREPEGIATLPLDPDWSPYSPRSIPEQPASDTATRLVKSQADFTRESSIQSRAATEDPAAAAANSSSFMESERNPLPPGPAQDLHITPQPDSAAIPSDLADADSAESPRMAESDSAPTSLTETWRYPPAEEPAEDVASGEDLESDAEGPPAEPVAAVEAEPLPDVEEVPAPTSPTEAWRYPPAEEPAEDVASGADLESDAEGPPAEPVAAVEAEPLPDVEEVPAPTSLTEAWRYPPAEEPAEEVASGADLETDAEGPPAEPVAAVEAEPLPDVEEVPAPTSLTEAWRYPPAEEPAEEVASAADLESDAEGPPAEPVAAVEAEPLPDVEEAPAPTSLAETWRYPPAEEPAEDVASGADLESDAEATPAEPVAAVEAEPLADVEEAPAPTSLTETWRYPPAEEPAEDVASGEDLESDAEGPPAEPVAAVEAEPLPDVEEVPAPTSPTEAWRYPPAEEPAGEVASAADLETDAEGPPAEPVATVEAEPLPDVEEAPVPTSLTETWRYPPAEEPAEDVASGADLESDAEGPPAEPVAAVEAEPLADVEEAPAPTSLTETWRYPPAEEPAEDVASGADLESDAEATPAEPVAAVEAEPLADVEEAPARLR